MVLDLSLGPYIDFLRFLVEVFFKIDALLLPVMQIVFLGLQFLCHRAVGLLLLLGTLLELRFQILQLPDNCLFLPQLAIGRLQQFIVF